MKSLSERISYLRGLSEGLNITEIGPQGKIVNGILEVLGDVVEDMYLLRAEFEDFKEYVESIDDDLNNLEEGLYQDMDYIEMACNNCGEEIYFDSDVLEDEDVIEVICPKCNEVVFVNDGSFDLEPSMMEDEIKGERTWDKNEGKMNNQIN